MSGFSAINYALSKKLDNAILTGMVSHSVDNVNKTITFTFNDGTSSTIQFSNPTDGVGINTIYKDNNNHLIVTLTDGSTIDAGELPVGDDSGVVKKTDIVTSIDNTNTDDKVPSAKAVYNNLKNNNVKTYCYLKQLGLTSGCTVQDVYMAMSDGSIAVIAVSGQSFPDAPAKDGVLIIQKNSPGKVNIVFKQSHKSSVSPNYMWIGTLKGDDGSSLSWQRVCTTPVADVEETKIEIDEAALEIPIWNNRSKYKVINGICYVTVELNVNAHNTKILYGYKEVNTTSLPKIGFGTKGTLNVQDSNSGITAVLDKETTVLKLHGTLLPKENSYAIQGSFSYPVAE